jgi:aspartate/methionine/tyrosine aminotransferase
MILSGNSWVSGRKTRNFREGEIRMKVVINKSERFLRAPQALMGSMKLTGKLIKSRGLEFIDLDPVVPEFPAYGDFVEKVNRVGAGRNLPADLSEINDLKESLAIVYGRIYGRKINPLKDIAITPGSRLTAVLLCLGLVNPNQAVALPDPGLAMYRLAAVMSGASVQPYSLLEKNDYLPNLSSLFEPPPRNLSIVFLNYPHNPTGAEADLYFYRDLIHQLKYENILVVLDSPFCGKADPQIELPLQNKKAMNLMIELHSFGFPGGLEGLGFAIGHRGAISNLDQIIQASGFKPTRGQINQALAIVEFNDELASEYIERINRRRRILADGLKEIGWQVRAGRLVPFVWARVPAWATSAGFARKLLMQTGVRCRPGTDFGENGEGYLRFSLTVPDDKIAKALENIKNKPSMYRKRGG